MGETQGEGEKKKTKEDKLMILIGGEMMSKSERTVVFQRAPTIVSDRITQGYLLVEKPSRNALFRSVSAQKLDH